MQLSMFEHLDLSFSSSEVSFEIIGINLITSLVCLLNKKVDLCTVCDTFVRQTQNTLKVHVIRNDSFSHHTPFTSAFSRAP